MGWLNRLECLAFKHKYSIQSKTSCLEQVGETPKPKFESLPGARSARRAVRAARRTVLGLGLPGVAADLGVVAVLVADLLVVDHCAVNRHGLNLGQVCLLGLVIGWAAARQKTKNGDLQKTGFAVSRLPPT